MCEKIASPAINDTGQIRLSPLTRVLQHIHELLFAFLILCKLVLISYHVLGPGARDGVHIGPARGTRETHEDTLDTSVRCAQAKASTAIVDEVELHVATPTELLPLLLLWGIGHVLSPLDYGYIGWQERGQTVRDEREESFLRVGGGAAGSLEETGVKIVKENAADTSAFAAVRDVEVLVTPSLELGVISCVVSVTGFLDGLVEMLGIFWEKIGRGQIGATAEPPVLVAIDGVLRVGSLEVSVVQVHCRRHGVVWVKNQRETGSKEGQRVNVSTNEGLVIGAHLLNSRTWKLAVHHGDVNTGFLEDVSVLQHAGDATATIRTGPGIRLELLAIYPAQLLNNLLLVLLDELFHP